ncbi:MAG: hypothetical protein EZS28_038429 [Streblomastix strix]|uniref:Uncharacterized protein n=1 Tax=Streblomastix strix TaxID=222440 RepID=A0A5J4U6Z3_9EUKA|nr:MAG: hypothetical protein EZS28_038429 [Streblomastix strix]
MSRQTTRKVSFTKSGVIARELMDKMIEEQEKNKTNETFDDQDNKLLDDLLSKYVNETPKRVIPEFFVKWYPVIDVPSDLKNICTGKESIYIAGQLCEPNDEPFNQIVQCIQDDSSTDDVISNWNNVIHIIHSLKEKEKEKTNIKRLVDEDNGVAEVAGDGKIITKTHAKNIKIDDVDFDDNLIVFKKEQMMGLLNKFETTFENLEKTTAPIRYSPHTEEFIKDCYTECKIS